MQGAVARSPCTEVAAKNRSPSCGVVGGGHRGGLRVEQDAASRPWGWGVGGRLEEELAAEGTESAGAWELGT